MQKVYKVVKAVGQHLHSITYNSSAYSMEYFPGQWAFPPIGKVFCFDHLVSAKHFLEDNCLDDHYEIWEALAVRLQPAPLMVPWGEDIGTFWPSFLRHTGTLEKLETQEPPTGTMWATRLKLVKRVFPA